MAYLRAAEPVFSVACSSSATGEYSRSGTASGYSSANSEVKGHGGSANNVYSMSPKSYSVPYSGTEVIDSTVDEDGDNNSFTAICKFYAAASCSGRLWPGNGYTTSGSTDTNAVATATIGNPTAL